MTQEEKILLLKDLCSRLPYGVKVEIDGYYIHVLTGIDGNTISTDRGINYPLRLVKPYLRPISSMTEEEVETLFNVLKIDDKRGDWLKVNDIGIIRLFTEVGKDFYEIAAAFDYLNSIHIDYRGCIEKGLALEAPEGMYNI